MNFAEVDLFGVYVSPISMMIVGAWLLVVPLHRIATRVGLSRSVWHPALFWFSSYLILLAAIVHLVAR